MRFNAIESIYFTPHGLKPKIKSPTIWGCTGHTIAPICYLRKANWMSTWEWEMFLSRLHFELRAPSEDVDYEAK